jgi:hypothetical protein
LVCEDKSLVACRQIFSEISGAAYNLQVRNSRPWFVALRQEGADRGGGTAFLKVAGFAFRNASATAAILGEYMKGILCIIS